MQVVVSLSHISGTPSSSLSSPAPACGLPHSRQFAMNFSIVSPSHGLQFFMNCSNVSHFPRVQSFSNRVLQHAFPMGSKVLPAKPVPARTLHRVTDSFGHPPVPVWGPLWAAGAYLLHCGPPGTTLVSAKFFCSHILTPPSRCRVFFFPS